MDRRRGTTLKVAGVSRKSIVHTSRHGLRSSSVLSASKRAERMKQIESKRRMEIREMGWEERQAVAQMDLDTFGSNLDAEAVSSFAPPGEPLDVSHEGGEYEVFEDIADTIALATGRKRVDHRDRRDRTELATKQWEAQLDTLVNAYLAFRQRQGPDGLAADPEVVEGSALPFELETVDLFVRKHTTFRRLTTDHYPNETLVRNGFLGCSPLHPTICISFRTLHTYRQIHRTCPQYSQQAFAKSLCFLHNERKVPYHAYLRNQLMQAYDVYLEICRRVDERINKVLDYNSSNRLRRQCPACFHRIPNENDIGPFSVLVSMDGNNSLKCIRSTERGHQELSDSRQIVSDRWLTAPEVDELSNEVQTRTAWSNNDDAVMENEHETPANQKTSKCADRWRNAGPESHKQMFSLFDETGVFIACCRHRMVLYACDMIRSGELAKYPLAIVNKMLDDIGERIGCAYDIGCTFSKTLENSCLGNKATEKMFRLMVGAFHGYAHNRECQLQWHPLYIRGTGLTEGEGCEHIFSSSNDIARNTRHASRFHRKQAIEEYFYFWDLEKYTLLSKFLVNHYREATELIRTLEWEVAEHKKAFGVCDDDFDLFLHQEQQYFKDLDNGLNPVTQLKMQYVKVLNDAARWQREFESARAALAKALHDVATVGLHVIVEQARNSIEKAAMMWEATENQLDLLEASLGVKERWNPEHPEYKEYHQENVVTEYQTAVDDLERLVVMRLFELTKMRASGTGYKLRRQIGKALQRRSEAVRAAINRYNTQAARFDPPKPELSWSQIVDYAFLGEFNVLRLSISEKSHEKWVLQANREIAVKFFKLCRAREEVVRLNIEVQRLESFMEEETKNTLGALEVLATQDPALAAELLRRWEYRSSVNDIHRRRLAELRSKPYFTGKKILVASTPNNAEEHDDSIEEDTHIEVAKDFVAEIAD